METEQATVVTPGVEARQRILRAAERLFAQKGFAGAAVHEITDAAEVNRALLYYYFTDKHALYAAVVTEGLAAFTAMVEEALSTPGSHADRLGAFVRGHLDLLWYRTDVMRVVDRCLLDGDTQELGLAEQFQGTVVRLEEFFRSAQAAGEFRVVDPAIAARSLLGPSFIFSMWKLYEGDRFSPEVLADHITGQLIHGLKAAC